VFTAWQVAGAAVWTVSTTLDGRAVPGLDRYLLPVLAAGPVRPALVTVARARQAARRRPSCRTVVCRERVRA
jgi:hypothetical protein